jgi:hypothetical protein
MRPGRSPSCLPGPRSDPLAQVGRLGLGRLGRKNPTKIILRYIARQLVTGTVLLYFVLRLRQGGGVGRLGRLSPRSPEPEPGPFAFVDVRLGLGSPRSVAFLPA